MKTRLNILTGLILLVFAVSVINNLMSGFENANKGLEKLREKKSIGKQDLAETYFQVAFDKSLVVDSIYNQSNNTWAKITVDEGRVSLEQEPTWRTLVSPLLLVLFGFIILPTILVCFIKIMNAVKSAVFFDKKNIKCLRLMGTMFLLLPVIFILSILLENYGSFSIVKDTNYYVDLFDYIPTTLLIYGLLSFLAAEILSYGLRLKEEQDLTI